MRQERSQALFERAKKRIPGGVNSPVRAYKAVGRTPRFIVSAKGSRITDADGNEYIDYVCSFGPGILGHAHPAVVEAVRAACADGLSFGAPTEKEVVLAELVCGMMPSIELLRLVSSGTEAVMSAVRAARGFTGRDRILKFRGCYHGHSDGLLVKAGSGALTAALPDSAGVPLDFTKNTLVADYNDRESVERLFEANAGEIAAVVVEPVAANMGVVLPKEGFLSFLREITRKEGALLIFDEVITGFRLGGGGAQEYYGIRPDLTTLGKIIGGGMPIGAYGGRRDIMEMIAPSGPVYQAGTLSGNPVATAAGIETLTILKNHPEIYRELEEKTQKLAQVMRKALGESVSVNQKGSLLGVFFAQGGVNDYESALKSDTGRYADYFNFMLDRGIYLAPSQFEAMFVSAAHSFEDIERTCEAVREYAGRKANE
ncbi:MAG: glutamate-1-semialdehyde 2,1-aminomutase [Lachnospiraceae bacterium]|nr:glutamate-1-semialdehyde 2,1-aminomutase [Lachnospiraceae bacterium]